jgi:hypothetical protein
MPYSGLQPPAEVQTYAGQVLTNAFVLANWYNGLQYLLNPPVLFCYANATQGPFTSATALTFNVNKVDTYGGHTVNTSRYTFQAPGTYLVEGLYAASTSSGTFIEAEIRVNGVALTYPSRQVLNNVASIPVSPTVATSTVVTTNTFGDYCEIFATNQASSSSTASATAASWMRVQWLHQ